MLRFLSFNHLFTYGFLLVLTFVLRFPSFHGSYFQEDEAYYITAAERIVEGGVQYVDTWDNKPPVLVWFYTLFVWIFGDYALLAVRIFACIYLYVAALLLNQFVAENKLLERFSLLPAFLMIFLCSVPWYAQELNGELLLSLPMILAVYQILRVTERSRQNAQYLFYSGLLLGLCFMIKYQAVLVFLGLLLAYFTVQTATLSEVFSMIAGFVMTILVALVALFFTGALEAYWDIGVVYNLDYILIGKNPGEDVRPLYNLGQYGQLWGVFILMGLASISHFRLSFFTNAIRLRKVETVVLFWFGGALLTIVLGGGRLYLHYFYLLVPPLAIYAAKFFELRMRRRVQQGALILAMVVPLFTYFVFLISAYPRTFSLMDAYLTEVGWVHQMRQNLNEPHPLAQYIDRDRVHNGILVMEYEPSVYLELDLPCATKYTNFSMAAFKLAPLVEAQGITLISQVESDADIYRAFSAEMPEYIIDPLDYFPVLEKRLPVLFSGYQVRQVNDGRRSFKLYYR